MVRRKKFIGVSVREHTYFHCVHWFLPNSAQPRDPLPRGALAHRAACLRCKLRWSAIMAMNSLLVGLPLMPETV